MTAQTMDNLMRRVLLDAIRLDLKESSHENVKFVPSQYHREQMQKMLENPLAWARSKQNSLFE